MKKGFLVIVFFVLLFANNAFALPNCNMLQFELYDVELWEDTTKEFTFALNNYAQERFYIDKVNAFDFEEGITTEELSWQGVALSGSVAIIRVSIEAEKGIEERERKAKIELRGHFLSGKECKYSDVHDEFSVNVLKRPVHKIEPRCEGFSLYTLSEKFIDGFGEIEFIVENKTNYNAIIKLESEKLGISENIFSVRAGEEKHFSTEIQSVYERAELVYDVELADCGIPSEKTIIYSTVPEPAPTPTPPEELRVEMDATIERDVNGFLARISIYNPNEFPVEGLLEVIVPDTWNVDGEGIVSITPFTEIIAAIRIVPEEGFTGTFDGEIVFSYDDQEEREPITLELEREQVPGFDVIGAAFAILSSSAVAVGLVIVIIILLLILFTGPSRQRYQEWLEQGK